MLASNRMLAGARRLQRTFACWRRDLHRL